MISHNPKNRSKLLELFWLVRLEQTRDVACFQTKAIFINTTRKKQDARSTNKIQDCLIGTLELELDGEKLYLTNLK